MIPSSMTQSKLGLGKLKSPVRITLALVATGASSVARERSRISWKCWRLAEGGLYMLAMYSLCRGI